jgi:hypothetical protein
VHALREALAELIRVGRKREVLYGVIVCAESALEGCPSCP